MTLEPILGSDTTLEGDQATIESAARRLRLQVYAGDQAAQAVVLRAWKAADADIAQRQAAILAQVDEARKAGKPVTEAWLYQVARLDQLRAAVAAQYAQVGVSLDRQVRNAQAAGISDSISATQALIQAQSPVSLDFRAIDVERQVTGLVGRLQDGSPLRDLTFSNLSVDAAESVARALVTGALRGDSIRDIAGRMRLERNLALARAQTIARTEILRASREASIATMRQAHHTGLTKGWKWSVTLDTNTCGVCTALAGSVHPVSEDFETHPNCRCAPVPVTPSWEDLGFPGIRDTNADVPDADYIISRLGPEELRRRFGKGAAELIQGGYLKPKDLVRMVDQGRWGKQPRLARLSDLRNIAISKGWTPPAPKATPVPGQAAPPAQPTAAVPGLNLHPDRLKAEMDDLLRQQTDFHMRWNDATRAVNDAADAAGREYRLDPEYRRRLQERETIDAEWAAWSRRHADAWRDRNMALADQYRALRGSIPPDQARRLLADLDLVKTYARVLDARVPSDPNPGLYFTRSRWRAITQAATGYDTSGGGAAMLPWMATLRGHITWGLPIRDRLRMPALGDALFPGSRQSLTPKSLAKVMEQWETTVRVQEWMEQRLGSRTGWTGAFGLGGTGSGAAGTFGWNGTLSLNRNVVEKYALEDRLKVIIHESFHGMSHGANPHTGSQYIISQGWEEGVVEMATQVFESRILADLGITPTKSGYNSYSKYTKPLERIRESLGMSGDDYYTSLIGLHVNERSTQVRAWATDRGVTLSESDLRALGR